MKRRSRGFTLLEVLLALTLAAALMVLLVGSLHLVREGWSRLIERDDGVQALSAARRFIQRTLASTFPALEARTQSPHMKFYGGEHEVEFVTPQPTHFDVPGLYRVRLSLRPGELVVQYAAERDEINWQNAPVYPLLDGVSTFALRYYGQRGHGMTRQWYASWPAAPTLPDAVQLSISRPAAAVAWTVEIRALGAELTAP